jgi:hypothetical protein
MDVTRSPIPGMMPHLAHHPALAKRVVLEAAPPVDRQVAGGGGPAPPTVSGGGDSLTPPIQGSIDGPDVLLPSGVRIRRKRIGAFRVGRFELQQAIAAVQLLPLQHQQLIARLGIPIELVPVAQLEQMSHTTQPVVGATLIDGPDGHGRPTQIRIAAFQSRLNTNLGEAVQHEIGHAIAVVANQDTSEQTAIQYAQSY